MSGINQPTVSAVLSANGTATGYAQVPSTKGFNVGAEVNLVATGVTTLEGVITEIRGNLIGIRAKTGLNYGRVNLSAFTTALAATLYQPEQYVNPALNPPESGSPADLPLGTIVATATPQSNSSTATPFPLVSGGEYSIQPDVEAWIASGTSSADAIAKAVAGTGTRVEANALYTRNLPLGHTHFAASAVVAGTVNAKVNSVVR